MADLESVAQVSRDYAKAIRSWSELDVRANPELANEVIQKMADRLDVDSAEIERLRTELEAVLTLHKSAHTKEGKTD